MREVLAGGEEDVRSAGSIQIERSEESLQDRRAQELKKTIKEPIFTLKGRRGRERGPAKQVAVHELKRDKTQLNVPRNPLRW